MCVRVLACARVYIGCVCVGGGGVEGERGRIGNRHACACVRLHVNPLKTGLCHAIFCMCIELIIVLVYAVQVETQLCRPTNSPRPHLSGISRRISVS